MLSIGHAGNTFSAAGGLFAAMLDIYTTGRVSETFRVPTYLRCIAAVCAASGAIIAGGRLMPVLGELRALQHSQHQHSSHLSAVFSSRCAGTEGQSAS